MDRKELIRKYKDTPQPMGIFRITNTKNGKVFMGASVNVPAMLNRCRAQLNFGSHPNTVLQADWQAFGESAFTFDEAERLKPLDKPDYDPTEDLATLEALWFEKLAPYGDKGYNEPKKAKN